MKVPALLLFTAGVAATAGCSRPPPPPTEQRPAPQAGSAARQLQAPLEKARAVQDTLDDAERQRQQQARQAQMQ